MSGMFGLKSSMYPLISFATSATPANSNLLKTPELRYSAAYVDVAIQTQTKNIVLFFILTFGPISLVNNS